MSRQCQRPPLFIALLAALLLAPEAGLAANPTQCAELTLNTTLRREGKPVPNQRDCFQAPVLTRGVLTLDVSALSSRDVEPRLVLPRQGSTLRRGYRLLWETPRSLIVEIEESGAFLFAVMSEDPREPLPSYKLRSTFVSADFESVEVVTFPADPSDLCADAAPLTSKPIDDSGSLMVLEAVDEEDCDVMELSLAVSTVLLIETADLPLHVRLSAGPDCAASPLAEGLLEAGERSIALPVFPDKYRLDVSSATGDANSYHLDLRYFAPCTLGEVDDHGDTPLCATPVEVEGSVVGEIWNSAGDDEDFFTFVLEEQRSVEIEIPKSSAAHLTLYDKGVQRLDGGGRSRDTQRIVRTLAAGRHYVRVRSTEGGSEAYVLTLR